MNEFIIAILVTATAFLSSAFIFPIALRFAIQHDIVDSPNVRKLQRRPIPVFGGVAVYVGVLAGIIVLNLFISNMFLFWGAVAMFFMLIIGVWDDRKDVSPFLRLFLEISIVYSFIVLTNVYINDFHGLWGIHEIKPALGIPLSIFVGVGIINAINLMDGVDGYSSGYGIMACGWFALAFFNVGNFVLECMMLLVIGALLPFFMHNVFGAKSKMFIGDGGTLMLGTLLTVMVFYSMWNRGKMCALERKGMSVIAFLLAIGCVPIFDTLRVMISRMLRGSSPFHPDKTHLHHLFVDLGFSHLGAALFILFANFMVVVMFLLICQVSTSLETQTYAVLSMGVLITTVFYKFMRYHQNAGPVDEEGYPQGSKIWHLMCKVGKWTHREDRKYWRVLKHLMDGPMMGKKMT